MHFGNSAFGNFTNTNYPNNSSLSGALLTNTLSTSNVQLILDNLDLQGFIMADPNTNLVTILGQFNQADLANHLSNWLYTEGDFTSFLTNICTNHHEFILYSLQNGSLYDFFLYFHTHYTADFENMYMALSSNSFVDFNTSYDWFISSANMSDVSLWMQTNLDCNITANMLLNLPDIQNILKSWFNSLSDIANPIYNGFAEPNALWNYLVQYDNTNLRSIIYSQFDNDIMLTWFETNERSNFITQASTVAPGHVGTWQTSNAGHSKETYFNMVRTYYGQSAYDLLIQRYLNNTRTYLDSFGINEWHMYGSSRLGIYQINLNLVTQRFDADISNGSFEDPENISTTSYEPSYNFYTLQRGNKRYELSNHASTSLSTGASISLSTCLGNVLAVVSDRKLPECIGDSFLYNKADITNATDYSPFGAPLPGRVYNTPTNITSDTTAWIKGWEPSTVSTSYVGNRLKVDVSTLWAGIRRSIKTVPGHNYVFKTTVDLHTAGSVYIFARRMSPNNTSGNIKVIHTSVSGTYEVHFTALDTLTYLHVEEGGSYTSGTVTFYLENTLVQDKQLGGKSYRFGFNSKEKDDEINGGGNAYDFGARIYDARLGRWCSLDQLFPMYCGISGYNYGHNNPIRNLDIAGYFVLPANMSKKEKEFASRIINSANELLNDPYVLKGLMVHSGLTESQIKLIFTNGYGPTIEFSCPQQPDNIAEAVPFGLTKFSEMGNDAESIQKFIGSDKIILNKDILINKGNAIDFTFLSNPNLPPHHAFYLGVLLLHEIVHIGDARSDGVQHQQYNYSVLYDLTNNGENIGENMIRDMQEITVSAKYSKEDISKFPFGIEIGKGFEYMTFGWEVVVEHSKERHKEYKRDKNNREKNNPSPPKRSPRNM